MIVQRIWVLISAICCVGKHKGRNYETGRHRVHLVSFIIITVIIIIISFRPHYGSGIDTDPNRNEYQEYFLGGKGGRCVGLSLLPSRVDCLEI
jgi:hypothetical protein